MLHSRNLYILLFSLYWAQGLPVGFMTHALPVILRAHGVSLAQIGGFGLLMLPWSIKVFWAPVVDRYGDYRCWIIPLQCLTVSVLIGLSFLPIASLNEPIYLWAFFVALLSMNVLGATQDIATDGLAVHALRGEQQHWGNTLQVMGSRLGFIGGGGAVLWILDWLSWHSTFLILAGLVALNTLPILIYAKPQQPSSVAREKTVFSFKKIKHYLAYFLDSPVLSAWLGVLLSFKLADGLAGPLLKPLMVDLGLTFSQIGLYVTMLGAGAALIGAVIAGYSLTFIHRSTALIFYSLLKILSLMAYAGLAFYYENQIQIQPWCIYLINAFEDMTSSMLLVIMLTLIMQYSRKSMAGTDFTLQVALMATVSGALYVVSGLLGDWLGYFIYLSCIVLIATLSLGFIFRWSRCARHTVQHDSI